MVDGSYGNVPNDNFNKNMFLQGAFDAIRTGKANSPEEALTITFGDFGYKEQDADKFAINNSAFTTSIFNFFEQNQKATTDPITEDSYDLDMGDTASGGFDTEC